MNRLINLLLLASVAFVFFGCSEDDGFGCQLTLNLNVDEQQLEVDLETIDAFLEENNITAQIDAATGLRYVITDQGTGTVEPIGLCDQVSVFYEGRLLSDGSRFDGTGANPVNFVLGGLITGWQIGIPLIPRGGSATLYIPSVYAYGTRGQGTIPPNASIVFDIELGPICPPAPLGP
ncbi:MAG: FKBP-type peptidyl-prolyl cis-trans isomerase [Bacteroidota bacterium]